MKKYKIAFATGSRADYGIVRNYISKLNEDSEIDFSVLVTGALLDEKFGNAVKIVEQDGFKIAHACKVSNNMDCTADTISIMATVLDDFGRYFQDNRYDLLIILGDRYEIYTLSIAAAMQRIPILHLHGGEITLANYDEFIRHSITKMSTYHFTSTEEYRHRVIQLGENPETVFYLGALGAENCLNIDINNVPEELFDFNNGFTVLFHPETLNAISPVEQIEEVLKAIAPYTSDYKFIFIGSNADTHSGQITQRVYEFCTNQDNCHFYSNLHPDGYHYLIKHSIALIGNSSSGIIEVPSLGSYTVNIGDRQTGRVKSASIVDVKCDAVEIGNAIEYVIEHKCEPITDTPYYKANTAENYYKTTKQILIDINKLVYKEFYDIKF
ncbi:UDP-N-acetylglucosamine 2-epimerase [uncultured Bacteroides sp.]|jgi:UDP-hydrolysing UDP-N-acetyl-D-glucosamine 2-epimerase|uniref:UDP-N-acetylglucosamine 2-epimerase n=1 Tax=uncultured Bacteroides sp. TaxID=162156 RepID=UPI0025838AD8|nr:UDP-N-acetylglucosamine 2-epimerase [uncultured Bacteroides sp.]